MSCDTLNQGSIGLQVSMAQLPEGFCPASMQELANAIAERLIVSPNQSFTSFAAGSVEPSSNVGPWLKDCLVWFVFDDNTARYVPIAKGGFNTEQFFSASSTFVVPDFISQIRVSAWGGGGGGGAAGPSNGGGGGGGAFTRGVFTVIAGQSITITIGAGGTAGSPGTDGGDTTVLTMTAGGGKGGVNGGGSAAPGVGGTASGGSMNFDGGPGCTAFAGNGGIGGNSPQGGSGGRVDFSLNRPAIINGSFPGGGGAGGATSESPGNGGGGAALIEY